MKRVHLQKEKPVSHFCQEIADSPSAQSDSAPPGARRRVRTSAAMIGLALSMGATSLLLPRQDDGAAAAEPKVPDTAISAALAQSSAAQPEVQPSGIAQFPMVRLVEHIVQDGQTLQQLANQYQVKVQSITLANGLSLDAALKAGQTLKIPVSGSPSAAIQMPASSLVASADLDQLPPVGSSDRQASQGTEQNSALDRLRQQRDKLRDSLAELRREESTARSEEQSTIESSVGSSLPQNHQVEIANALAVLPSLSPASEAQAASVDQAASLAQESGVDRPAAAASQQVATRPAQPGVSTSGIQTYRVNPGDTLARIARTYNIPQSLLINANHLSDPNVIFVGQVLTVPSVQPPNPQPPVAVASEALSAGVIPAAAPIGNTGASPAQPNQLMSVANAIQPSVTPTVPAVPALVAQTAPVEPAAAPNLPESAQPLSEAAPSVSRQIAVAPLAENATGSVPIAPGVDDNTRAVDSDLSSRFNPYVANLLSEFRELRQRHQPESIAAVQPAAGLTPAIAAVNPTSTGGLAVAPHFSERLSRNSSTLSVSNSVEATAPTTVPSAAQPGLVASAPLGSESYDPLLQPITGRLVSPDLPPLPGADTFLPEDGLFNGYIWPARGMLTSGYGWRWGRMHQGIDIAADVGTPIHAAANGTVEFAGWNSGGYGNMVEVRHADGSLTRYAHMNAIAVQVGQDIDQGEQLGEMGSTGYSTGPHLHFEVHLPDQGTVNPIAYLPTDQQQAQQ